MRDVSLTPLGDHGITVKLGDGISVELSQRVVMNAGAISAARIRGVTDVVPSYASLGVFYDPFSISFDDLSSRVENILAELDTSHTEPGGESRLIRISVRYDGEDMDEVARRTRLTRDEIADIHSSREYRVFVVGFVPGWAYLGTLDPRLILPRREAPRKRVPAGAVAIAESQTGVYPGGSPGGWHLIGSTSERMFDWTRPAPALLHVGDRVQFESAT